MKRRPMVIAGLALAVLTVLGGAAAHAAGRSPAPKTTEQAAGQTEVRDGTVYRNGERAGTVPADARRLAVTDRDGKTPRRGTGEQCPAPGAGGRAVATVEVKDGKIYRNGKEIGRVPGDGSGPLTVSVEGGEVRVTDKATEPPGGAAVTRGTGRGKGAGGPSVSCVKTR